MPDRTRPIVSPARARKQGESWLMAAPGAENLGVRISHYTTDFGDFRGSSAHGEGITVVTLPIPPPYFLKNFLLDYYHYAIADASHHP